MKTYTLDFTPTATEENAKVLFLLGGNNIDGSLFTKNSKIHLDNVTLSEKTSSPTTTTVSGTVQPALAGNTVSTSTTVTVNDQADNKCQSNGNSGDQSQ